MPEWKKKNLDDASKKIEEVVQMWHSANMQEKKPCENKHVLTYNVCGTIVCFLGVTSNAV